MSKETAEEVKVISPGAMLKAAREKQGLSREEVADQLHLRFTIIKDLEEDHYTTDISATFTKGYLKLYSKLLGIDEEQVLSAYQQLGTQEKEPARLQSFSQKVARQASDQRLMWVTYLVLILVLAGVIAWWVQQDDTSLSNFIDRNVSAASQSNKPAAADTNQQPVNAEPAGSSSSSFTTSPPDSSSEVQNTTLPAPQSNDSNSSNNSSNNSANLRSEAVPDATQSDTTQTDTAQTATTQTDTQSPDSATGQQAESYSDELQDDELTTGPQYNSTGNNAGISAPSTTETEPTETATQEPSADTEAGVFAILEAEQPDTHSIESSLQDTSTTTTAQPGQYSSSEPNPASAEAEPALNQPLAAPVDLVFTFSGDCWMKLTDATGEDVAYGIKQAGRVMPVSGVPPFEVVLGAPESVQISYAGEAIDMTRFRSGYTARFQLPLSE